MKNSKVQRKIEEIKNLQVKCPIKIITKLRTDKVKGREKEENLFNKLKGIKSIDLKHKNSRI